MQLPNTVTICEVGPRDGLQNEKISFSVEQKIELIERSVEAGAKIIEIGSFVHPKAIPQMADTDEVCQRMHRVDGVEYRRVQGSGGPFHPFARYPDPRHRDARA